MFSQGQSIVSNSSANTTANNSIAPSASNSNLASYLPTSSSSTALNPNNSGKVETSNNASQEVAAAVAATPTSAATTPSAEKPPLIRQDELTNGYIDRVVALYEFKPEAATPGAIGFPKDAIINIIDKPSEWWFGEYNGNVGILPYNYVKSIVKMSG